MITGRLLNQGAELNNFKNIGGVSYVVGDTIIVAIQLYNDELETRHIPDPTAAVSVLVNFANGEQQTLTMDSFSTADLSLWSVEIVTDAIPDVNGDLQSLVGGNLVFTLEDPAGDRRFVIFNALQQLITT